MAAMEGSGESDSEDKSIPKLSIELVPGEGAIVIECDYSMPMSDDKHIASDLKSLLNYVTKYYNKYNKA